MPLTAKLFIATLFVICSQQIGTAQTVVSKAEFSPDTLTPYTDTGTINPTTSVSGGVLTYTTDLSASPSNNGVRWTEDNHSSSDANLADYTVSFDLAVTKGTLTNVSANLTIGGTGTDNVTTAIDLSQVSPGGGFAHYSYNLNDLSTNQFFNSGNAKLVPTDSSLTVELATLGDTSGIVTFQIKNFKITRKDSSSSTTSTTSSTSTTTPPSK